ncbi:uncharacterized protein LY79DRAFT_579526 [Colletotrichum navitas]|uniref:Uncharacterized protein n=1 Tax=Colletotrichum navitas TaxID=681940 RepID=A0AAD8PZU8_9PEZI|nr:uncharacterized protein LY79DRAFT_579526 [Colletotrichum navitas]KAK1593183.1 hypothetical protein LY79DRAFT_579526 [Colletotrichum navitas]
MSLTDGHTVDCTTGGGSLCPTLRPERQGYLARAPIPTVGPARRRHPNTTSQRRATRNDTWAQQDLRVQNATVTRAALAVPRRDKVAKRVRSPSLVVKEEEFAGRRRGGGGAGPGASTEQDQSVAQVPTSIFVF